MTANTYFWSSSGSASSRRSNEQKRLDEVKAFLVNNGFVTAEEGNSVTGERDGLTVAFSYSESCRNVYKHLTITRNGKRSNITALKKLLGI
jgi:hypothetical protein